MKRLLLLFSALALVGCLDVSGPGGSNPAFETFDASLNVDLADTAVWKQTANGTYFKDEVIGTGASLFLPNPEDSIFVDYTGWLKDATQFDTGTNVAFQANRIIVGFIDGMTDMKIGGTRLVVIPSNLGFGNARNGQIPPNSTLVFRIKLNAFTT
jgi:FKBP-type peptidyl-prolyl cis-trans isomerase